MSHYVLGKEKTPVSVVSKIITKEGICLTDNKAKEMYVVDYYEKLYDKFECRLDDQKCFLDLIQSVIGKEENEMLTAEVTEKEVW